MEVSALSYDAFKEKVINDIRDYLPEKFTNADVSINQVLKNNGLQLDGLVVRPEGEFGQPMPTVYLNDIYENGRDTEMALEEVLDRISETIVSHMGYDMGFDISQITDYSQVADRITPRLINAEQNAELLQDRPHKEVADLAVTYSVSINSEASVQVTNSLLENWGVSIDELHDKAVENLNHVVEPSFRGMSEVLAQMMGGMAPVFMNPNEKDFMYVLSNEGALPHGAAQLLNPSVMDQVCDRFPDGFYILPSSIHETIIVPSSQCGDARELADMVQSINGSELKPEEILSDGVYKYNAETRELSRADLEQTEDQSHSQTRSRNIDVDLGH